MSGGQQSIKLSGLPQLFSAKGYETFFTTGCLTDYDNWDSFLPAHGFETKVTWGIKHSDWDGPEHRGLNWGVHDDSTRVAKGEAKKPLFLTHYTISSHKPDFSSLYKGQKYADNIKNYLEIRYFTDMEFGKFMDRMAAAGILKDTIVVISGDHGQGPEFGNDVPEDRDVSATRVAGAIVAEGRLGKAVGMVMDDATEQYDILNTLADITGVPEGGFEQDGVGRSLKRKIKFGERIVYSNNPTRKMSVVRGHERLRYDKVTDSMLLHNADTDHDMEKDLLPTLTEEERAEWISWRDAGRRINAYYTKRWEVSWLLFVVMMAPFVADVVIVRLRDLRFTFELVAMAIEEKDHADSMAVSSDQVLDACLNVAGLVIVATVFAVNWKNWRQIFIQFTSQSQ
eukprot:jgi/Phyca11/536397/estExt2_fgenesh1_pg.C_PHYCAscaffold_520052